MKPDTYREHLNDLQVEIEALRAKLKEAQTGDLISRAAAQLPHRHSGCRKSVDKFAVCTDRDYTV